MIELVEMDSRRGVISIPLIRVTVTKTKKKGGRTVFHPIDRAVGGGGGLGRAIFQTPSHQSGQQGRDRE